MSFPGVISNPFSSLEYERIISERQRTEGKYVALLTFKTLSCKSKSLPRWQYGSVSVSESSLQHPRLRLLGAHNQTLISGESGYCSHNCLGGCCLNRWQVCPASCSLTYLDASTVGGICRYNAVYNRYIYSIQNSCQFRLCKPDLPCLT
jgi:hypothetical protein